jgi:hypothetical protein
VEVVHRHAYDVPAETPEDIGQFIREDRLARTVDAVDTHPHTIVANRLGHELGHPSENLQPQISHAAILALHDCRIHAISIGEYDDDTLPPARVLLDLDYILKCVDPARGERYFTFWISPATLVFEGAWGIEGNLGPLHELLEIADLHTTSPARSSPRPNAAAPPSPSSHSPEFESSGPTR